MYIGQDKTNANHWSGVLSDIRLYNAILSSTDVSDIYYAGLVSHSEGAQVDRFDVQDTKAQSPIATWHMDEGNGTVVNDSSPNGNTMTVTSATWGTDGATGNPRRMYMNFSGTSQYLKNTTTNKNNFDSTSWSVAGWFRHPSNLSEISTLSAPQYWYKMNDNAANTTVTESISANNGTSARNTSVTSVSGAVSTAMSFNGTNDYVTLPSGFANYTSGITISMWVKPTSAAGSPRFFDLGNGNGSDNIWFGRNWYTNDMIYQVYNGGSAGTAIYARSVLETNVWQHIVVTESATGAVVIYKNGAVVGGGTTTVPNNLTRTLNYFGKTSLDSQKYNGYMDDVRIYNSTLTASQVADIYDGSGMETSTIGMAKLISGASSNQDYKVFLNQSGYLCYLTLVTGTTDTVCTGSTLGSLADSKWHHFEAVRNSTTAINVYIDGSLQGTNGSPKTTGSFGFGSIVTIGIDSDATRNAYAGSLDDFAIYNYARTATQVKTDAAIGIGGQKGALLGAQTNDPLTNNLVGYWKMDETSGNAADSSGNGNTGTWNGTSGHYVSGKYGGGGYAASGGSDYLNMGTPTNLNISGDAPYTISAWVKPVSALNGPIFSYGGGSRGHVISLIGNSGPIRSVHYSNDHNFVTTWTQNVWQHVVIAYDPTDGVGTEKLYVDGVFMESWNPSNLSITAGEAMYIGRESWSVGNVSTTYIDEVRLYNRALSPGEVSQIYNWTAGPVGFWRFEEGSGTSANDISGNSNTGTITQGGGGYDAGKYGKGYNFDNTSTSINAGSGSTLDDLPATAGMTVEAWINPKGQGENGTGFIVAKNVGTTPSAGWILQLAASYGFTFTVDGGTDLVRTTSTSAISPNTWSHITVTWDGVITTASSVHIFVNGVEASYATTTNGVSRVSDATSSVYIGNDSTGAATFNGTIDEVKIYNYAISQKQIISDYNGGHPIGGSPVGSQAVYYKFDEGYGTAFHDSGPNKMDGVITGAGWTNQGKFGKALFFNGTSSQYATVTDSTGSALDITGAITISAWIKNNVASGGSLDGGIVYKSPNIFGATNTKVYEIGFLDGIFYWQRGNGAGGDDSLSFTWDLGAGSWHHIVAVWDGTTTSEAMKIYVDGRLKTKGAANIASIRTTNDPLSISGHSGAFSYEFFDGLIDEVKIYSSALSVSQIQQDYNQGKSLVLGNAGINTTDGKTASSSAESAYCVPGDTGTCRPPVGEWTFEDQSSSTSVPDSSGNANTGTWGGTGGKHYTVGKIGNSGQFNGSDDRVDITTSSSLTPSAVSVSAWFNTTSTNGQIIFRKRTGGYGLETGNYASGASAGQVSFWYYDGAVNIHTASSTSTYNDGKWHFAEGTFDGANVIIYVDGIQVGKTASSNGIGYFAGNIGIGRDADYNAGYFTGSIDQVKVFDYGRSTAQAAYDYSRGKSIAWYKFNECTGSNVNDSMGISPVGVISIGGSGSQNATGTCSTTNSAAAWYNGVSGKFNYSLNLDGTDDFVTTTAFSPLAAAAQTTTSVSWGGWFYPTTSAASKTLLEKATEFQLTTDASSKPVCGIYYSGAFHNANSGAKALTLSAWNHVVCTYDGANIKTYLNGGLIDVTANTNAITAASSILYMGETSGGANFYKGQIDDVQIFNYPLTATQVKNVYSQNSAVRWGPLTGAP